MQSKKTDNTKLRAKLELRRYFLRKYHAEKAPRVLDCCQGQGIVWKTLREEFPPESYFGMDLKPAKGRITLDSRRFLSRPKCAYNVVDVDTYGSPWKHWNALLPTLQEPTTIFLTIGLIRMGGGTNLGPEPGIALGLNRLRTEIPPSFLAKLGPLSVEYCLAEAWNHGTLEEAMEAPPATNARYIGVRFLPRV